MTQFAPIILGNCLGPSSQQLRFALIAASLFRPIRSCRKQLAHGEGFGPEAEHADNNAGLRGRLNDRHPLRDFHDGPGARAHRKAEYTNATAPLPDRKLNPSTAV